MGMKRSKENAPCKYYSYNLVRVIQETRALEMKCLFHESDKAFRKLIQAEETRPEDPDGENAEIE